MDEQRFDLMSTWLAKSDSRRSTLRGLAAGMLAIGLSHRDLDGVAAGCKKVGQQCDKNADCCAGAYCKGGKKCVCKRGHLTCGDACCDRGQQCPEGGTEPPICCASANVCGHHCCPPDRLCVGSATPIDPPSDLNDVYKCICHDGFEEDADGNCGCPLPCGDDCCEEEDGEVCCATGRGPKQCVQLDSSENNCGACGTTCPKDTICKGGTCVCAPPLIDCDGRCVPSLRDPANCGGCGKQCPPDRTCQGGTCVCAPEFLACEGTCVSKQGGCCSDVDCWVYNDNIDPEYYCCNTPACGAFNVFPYQCVIDFPAAP